MMNDSVSHTRDTGRRVKVLAGIPAYNEARYIGSIVLNALNKSD